MLTMLVGVQQSSMCQSVYVALAIVLLLSLTYIVSKFGRCPRTAKNPEHLAGQRHGISIHKSQILRCYISHHRLFPKHHDFIYSYFMVGIPVRSLSSNWLLSADGRGTSTRWRKGWLHVSAEDHLYRGSSGKTLSQKLNIYLSQEVSHSTMSLLLSGSVRSPDDTSQTKGLNPTAFPHVYLLTSARFFDYKFSPASFWFLYSIDRKLEYVIAEVNNTFNERRMYLFPAPGGSGVFKQTCLKDFHVSPFSSRKGSYSILTTSPADGDNINIAVTLRSSKGHPKLVTRLWSVASAIDPDTSSVFGSIWLLLCWGYTVFLTCMLIQFQGIREVDT